MILQRIPKKLQPVGCIFRSLANIAHVESQTAEQLQSKTAEHAPTTDTKSQYSEQIKPLPQSKVDRKAHISFIATESFRAPKNPIVLCHGLFGYDAVGLPSIPFLQMRYWNKIELALRKLGCDVHTSRVGTASSLNRRATQLHQFLELKLSGRPVNLIAHSMGGLDCRYVVSHVDKKSYIVDTLTTIATPHRGSAFMDWVSIFLTIIH